MCLERGRENCLTKSVCVYVILIRKQQFSDLNYNALKYNSVFLVCQEGKRERGQGREGRAEDSAEGRAEDFLCGKIFRRCNFSALACVYCS